jgi:hypothetical protein
MDPALCVVMGWKLRSLAESFHFLASRVLSAVFWNKRVKLVKYPQKLVRSFRI